MKPNGDQSIDKVDQCNDPSCSVLIQTSVFVYTVDYKF